VKLVGLYLPSAHEAIDGLSLTVNTEAKISNSETHKSYRTYIVPIR
jgi:hypothetical protein